MDLGEGDFFALYIEDSEVRPGEEAETLVSMILTRATLESLHHNMGETLTREHVTVKLIA